MKWPVIMILFLFKCFIAAAQSPKPAAIKIAVPSPVKNNNYFSLTQQPVIRPGSIAVDHYTKNFGFFCRKELQLEKSIRVPVRLRLGDLNYCNYLEGKTR